MRSKLTSITLAVAFVSLAMGCAPTMKQEGGFLSDYSRLEKIDDDHSRWKDASWKKGSCTRIIVDPIQFNLGAETKGEFTNEERREIREYAQDKFTAIIAKHREVVMQPGPGVCRMRVAFTDIEKSAALANIHPLTRATGAGRGGAAVEAEIIDTESGKVIGMWTRRATGEFFEGSGMGDLADIKSAIDRWAKDADEKIERLWFST